MPLCELGILEIFSFPHFSLTCFDVLSWNLAYDFVLLYYDQVRVSSICVNFCGSYAPFWNLEYWKYTVFRTFLLHPLTYWAESLHITVLQIKFECRQFASFLELCLFSNLEYCKYSFLHFSLTRFDIIIELKFCTWLCFTVIQVNLECRQWA